MTSLPVACSLSAGELREREREIRALFADALVDTHREPRMLELGFAAGVAARVEALAEAERRCCAFLTFTTSESGLVIEAPEGAEEALDGFAAVAAETLDR